MYFKQFFDNKLAQYAYMVGCQASGEAVVIDPERDIDQYIKEAKKENLEIVAAADTHIHADYISGLREFAERGVKVYASDEGDEDWKYEWLKGSNYNYELLKDGDSFNIGNIIIEAVHTPGHTPEHLVYKITDGAAGNEPMGLATGDFVFVGDVGRPDLLESAAGQAGVMEPSARILYKSVEKFKQMPEYLQIWPGHGAGSACGKALGAVPETTVGYELRFNPSIKHSNSEDEFVNFILEGQPEPPLYFARMKRDNKAGPAVLGDRFPEPRKLSVDDINSLANPEGFVVLDTRERDQYSEGHLPGSLLTTMNKEFNTVAGSYVREDEPIYLIIDEDKVDDAVRELLRVGLDNIEGYVSLEDFTTYVKGGGKLDTLEVVSFETLANRMDDPNSAVLDVRKASEYDDSHISDALNIAHTRMLVRQDELPKDKHLYVHCQAGGRSAVAAALLKRDGFSVSLVDDDYSNWEANHKDRLIAR